MNKRIKKKKLKQLAKIFKDVEYSGAVEFWTKGQIFERYKVHLSKEDKQTLLWELNC